MKIIAYKRFLLACIGIIGWFAVEGQKQPDSLYQYLVIAAKNNPTVIQKSLASISGLTIWLLLESCGLILTTSTILENP